MLFHGDIILPDTILFNSTLEIENGRITALYKGGPAGGAAREIDGYILPGLVDIHNHGGWGADYMDGTESAFSTISAYLASHGVTAALATSVCAPKEDLLHFLDTVHRCRAMPGARLLGAHLEGPFLSVANKGAQPERYLMRPADGWSFILDNADIVRLVTLSPELPGMPEMIHELTQAGIVVSGGHDDGIEPEILPAIEAGLSHTTHIYCAMSSLPKRDAKRYAGLCELAMTDERLTTEMIADNHHIPPVLARMIFHAKGPDKLCLVSDCLRAGGMAEDGTIYYLGLSGKTGQPFITEGGVAMLPDRTRLAGSVCALDQMIRNLVFDCNISLPDAVRMASLTPARILGESRGRGSLAVGKQADLCIMDRSLQILETLTAGKTVYRRE